MPHLTVETVEIGKVSPRTQLAGAQGERYQPEFVMVHFISAIMTQRDEPYHLPYIRDIFVQYNTSVHYIIERDGTIHCYVPEDRVAWHAGKGTWND